VAAVHSATLSLRVRVAIINSPQIVIEIHMNPEPIITSGKADSEFAFRGAGLGFISHYRLVIELRAKDQMPDQSHSRGFARPVGHLNE
jgi:hypothetical protein